MTLRKFLPAVLALLSLCLGTMKALPAEPQSSIVKVLVIASADPDHNPMILKSEAFFEKLALDNHFQLVFSRDASLLNDKNLDNCQVFIQLHLAPFDMTRAQQLAVQRFISMGKGWIGIHAAGLTGRSFIKPETPYWQWFEDLMGKVLYSPHPQLQTGSIIVEDTQHPVMKGIPSTFSIKDEWYEFDHSPRNNVHVLARADESSYHQNKPMGDHPMIWTNPNYNRALYIGIGHDVSACSDPNFELLIGNAIRWASTPDKSKPVSGLLNSEKKITILTNQLAYDLHSPKMAILKSTVPNQKIGFDIIDNKTQKLVWHGESTAGKEVRDWASGIYYSQAIFTKFEKPGVYFIRVIVGGITYESFTFQIDDKLLGKIVLPAITRFFYNQRASSPEEMEADRHIRFFGSDQTVDLHGGWCDASGDVSKYFSHLAYTNFMSPQQIPMVTWSMVNTSEKIPQLLSSVNGLEALQQEALYGADYLMRSLSPEGYFYMTVFSYFNKDANARRIVGLLADSKTTSDYQSAFREGAGMAIAALARISRWNKNGDFTSTQYLEAAEKAFAHLLVNNTRYDDDGKENVIDDYCALMASSELWIATGKELYRNEARKRTSNLARRLSKEGYFIANDTDRPFWHAADAGLPIIALARFLDKENDPTYRILALESIRKSLDYNLKITSEVVNPFGYPRQSFLYKGKVQQGFFIPHDNESGWWWQGEDARLGSLAAAAIIGGRLVYPGKAAYGVSQPLADYASHLVSWVLGCNPYNMCMMYGYGKVNVPYMASMYGHGSGKGGISNGITGKDGHGDGTGIDFKVEDNGNEWRWSEQWIPHTGWFLQAITAMSMETNEGK